MRGVGFIPAGQLCAGESAGCHAGWLQDREEADYDFQDVIWAMPGLGSWVV